MADDAMTAQQLDDALTDILDDDESRIMQERGTSSIPAAVDSVCIVGGGTSGFLTALGLRRAFPDLKLTLVESPTTPIIGVGEATVDNLVGFLHKGLELDIVDFYKTVRPTWKLGIRFEWGTGPEPFFDAPFGWNSRGLGLLGSLHYEDSINWMNLHAILMRQNKGLLVKTGDDVASSLLPLIVHAYHLENSRFVSYLVDQAKKRGIDHRQLHISGVETTGENIVALNTKDGERIAADMFIDCTGFASFLLSKTQGAKRIGFESSLFNDRALAFSLPHGGSIKPYTTAKTMNAGWCWNIPQEEEDHCGYVYSSSFISEEEARREISEVFPQASEPRLIRFESGRRDRAWIGNVFAVGNAYGFVEPLESTGILMIQRHVEHLIKGLRCPEIHDGVRMNISQELASMWDGLRWFLAIHFRFNRQRDTPYWRAAWNETNVEGAAHVLHCYEQQAPLVLRYANDPVMEDNDLPYFYGLEGYDCLLLGQQVPTNLYPPIHSREEWEARKARALEVAKYALPVADCLRELRASPEALLERQAALEYTL